METKKIKFNRISMWKSYHTAVTSLLAFLAIALALPANAVVFTPGLKQTRLVAASDYMNRSELTGDETWVYVPGAIMAYSPNKGSYKNPYDNTNYSWGDNAVWTYVGQMYFEAGKIYVFAEDIDDATYFRIDGKNIINDTVYNSIATGSFTPEATGWYDVDIRIGNGGGGSGPNNSVFGFGYNTDGITSVTSSNFKQEGGWSAVLDTGNMALLRSVYSETSWMTISGVVADGDDLVVTAAFAGVPSEGNLTAYYGDNDGGISFSTWDSSSTFATISAGDTPTNEYRIPGAGDAKFIAFCLDTTVGVATPAFDWSNTYLLAAAAPVFTLSVENTGYTSLSFVASCFALGENGSSVIADVQLSRDEAFSQIIQTKRLDLTGLGSEAVVFNGLYPDNTYYVRVVATNDKSASATTNPISVATYASSPAFEASVNTDHLSPELSLSFIRIGAGSAVNRIAVQISTTGNFLSPDKTQTFDVNISTVPTNVTGLVLSDIPYASSMRIIAYNDSGYSAFVDLTVDQTSMNGNNVWSGLSEDITDSNAYVFEGGLPEKGKTLYFNRPAGLSPVINTDTQMPSLRFTAKNTDAIDNAYLEGFHSCGYNLTGTGVLTFDAEKPILQASKGTNVVWNPIVFNRSNSQTVHISGQNGRLDLMGDLMLPEGVSNTTIRINGEGGQVHLGGSSLDFMGTLHVEQSFTLYLDNTNALTNVKKIFYDGGWGSFTYINNNTGVPMVFPLCETLDNQNGWSCTRVNYSGAPFIFPNATVKWRPRAVDSSVISADMIVKNLIVAKHGSNGTAYFDKLGAGAFIVTDTTEWDTSDCKHFIRLRGGCYYPETTAGLPPSGEFYYIDTNERIATLGLNSDYTPMLDGSSTPRIFFTENNKSRFGFTGFGGDRTVCWNADPTLNLTNTAAGVVSLKLTDEVSLSEDGKTYSTYYAYPSRFMFGNRSEFADGTIIFQNPIRYELGQNWDTSTYFESTNHVVSARLRGSLKLGHRDRTWKFSGNSFGGYLALEAENTDFTGHVSVLDKGNLLVNSNLVARSLTVQSGSGLGGTGALSTESGTTIKNGGALFGGEWNKGGVLSVSGKLTLDSNSALRAEVGSSNDYIGCVKLEYGSELKLTAPIYVDVDTDPSISPVRGFSKKILDWSEATFSSGSAPTTEMFVPRVENNPDLKKIYVTAKPDGLYVGYVTGRIPDVTIILLK